MIIELITERADTCRHVPFRMAILQGGPSSSMIFDVVNISDWTWKFGIEDHLTGAFYVGNGWLAVGCWDDDITNVMTEIIPENSLRLAPGSH